MTSPKSQKGRHSKVASSASDRPAQAGYEIDMTYSAEKVYVGLYKLAKEAEQRGDYTSQRCTTFNMVREAIKTIIPNDPFNKHYALTDELANIFRLQKGRLRICWIGSSKRRRILILFISQTLRKQGDVNDPYRIFTRMVVSGQFDKMFEDLGVSLPHRPPASSSAKPH